MDNRTRPIQFFHRGRVVQVAGLAPTTSVLAWLREQAHCSGTKEGCNEGDCGACTVLVAQLTSNAMHPDTAADPGSAEAFTTAVAGGYDGLRLRPINACTRFLPTLDGRALLSVEDLAAMAAPAALHPVQQAMVDCHASQCGFCTPGFVMTLTALYEEHSAAGTRPTRRQVADALAGNLCRCTGYRPIIDAALRMFDLPAVRLDGPTIIQALQAMAQTPALAYQGPAASGDGSVQRYAAPRTLEALAALRQAQPESRLLAGGTDIALWVNKQFRELGDIIHVGDVAELQQLHSIDGALHIGAAVPLEDAWAALVQHLPSLREVALRFAGPPVRHAGTLVGNLANGSPIGDSAPVLMSLGALVVLRCGPQQRVLRLEDFYIGYMQNRLGPGEFIAAAIVPLPAAATQVRAYKLSKRYDCDISALCAGLALTLAEDGTVAQARFAFGGMAAIVKRAATAEAAVTGRPWSEPSLRAAMAALSDDFQPLSDLRASAAYRLKCAANLLLRLWLETRLDQPLPAAALSVWAGLDKGRDEVLRVGAAV